MNMYAIVLFAIVACASAAPYHHSHRNWHHHNHDHDMDLDRFMDQSMFDTRSFWDELRRDMMGIETMLADFSRRFPSSISNEGIEGDVYKVQIPLRGYTEKEIAVKARKGLLIVQAVHKANDEAQRNYLDVRTLPNYVNEKGSWTYDNNVLIIKFPLNKNNDGAVDNGDATESAVTQAPEHSREEMDNTQTGSNVDPEVSPGRGDTELITNEIGGQEQTAIEATTYAVDLKGEIELLPVDV